MSIVTATEVQACVVGRKQREATLEERYQRQLALTGRLNAWLTSPEFELLPAEEREAIYEEYREQLRQLRRLGEERRPGALRAREEPLSGGELRGEILELFGPTA